MKTNGKRSSVSVVYSRVYMLCECLPIIVDISTSYSLNIYVSSLSSLKARHLSSSAFHMVHIGVPEQVLGWFPLDLELVYIIDEPSV